jgi:signal transduction histidine kinase
VTALSEHAQPPVSEARRIRRLMGRFIGGGYVAYFLVSIPEIRADAALVASWWTPVAVVLAFAPGAALLAASLIRHPRRLDTVIPLACGVGYLGALALWFVAWNGTHIAGPRTTWLMVFPGLVSLAMVLAYWSWLAVVQLLISMPAALIANGLARSDTYGLTASVGDLAWAWAFSAVFVLAGIKAVRTGEILDATREDAARIAADSAEQQARDAERLWYRTLIHDQVLTVLHSVQPGRPDGQLALFAQRAMDDLDAGSSDSADSAVDLMSVLRAVMADIDSGIAVTGKPPSPEDIELSPQIVRGIVAAAAEAARNCVRHAGPDATAVVHVESDAQQVRVTVIDDGVGFDPRAVRTDRLGLTLSIQGRMTALGGRADVSTYPGVGTRIRLWWPA